jgi:hypothetical protein
MKEVHYKELIPGKEYIIGHIEFDRCVSFYKGTFIEHYQRYYEDHVTIRFQDIRGKTNTHTYINQLKYSNWDTFYEIESINKDEVTDDILYLMDVKSKY